ncbi:MAG TPA: hypothetical protein DEB39_08165, partial [Planctomycetaceae bacterium]|nr:hypothetical protein [Planctomycetaceae bacterium]
MSIGNHPTDRRQRVVARLSKTSGSVMMEPMSHCIDIRLRERIDVVVRPPDARSIANRAILSAALGEGPTLFDCSNQPREPWEIVEALKQLGVLIETDGEREQMIVHGCGGRFPNKSAELVFRRCEVSARFLTAVLAFSDGQYRIIGDGRLAHLPMDDLLFGLGQLGAEVVSELGNGNLPVR